MLINTQSIMTRKKIQLGQACMPEQLEMELESLIIIKEECKQIERKHLKCQRKKRKTFTTPFNRFYEMEISSFSSQNCTIKTHH